MGQTACHRASRPIHDLNLGFNWIYVRVSDATIFSPSVDRQLDTAGLTAVTGFGPPELRFQLVPKRGKEAVYGSSHIREPTHETKDRVIHLAAFGDGER